VPEKVVSRVVPTPSRRVDTKPLAWRTPGEHIQPVIAERDPVFDVPSCKLLDGAYERHGTWKVKNKRVGSPSIDFIKKHAGEASLIKPCGQATRPREEVTNCQEIGTQDDRSPLLRNQLREMVNTPRHRADARLIAKALLPIVNTNRRKWRAGFVMCVC
jgi:hypothetical protein